MTTALSKNTSPMGGFDWECQQARCSFAIQRLRNLERAAEHEGMTEELADVLSTQRVKVEHRAETGVAIG